MVTFHDSRAQRASIAAFNKLYFTRISMIKVQNNPDLHGGVRACSAGGLI